MRKKPLPKLREGYFLVEEGSDCRELCKDERACCREASGVPLLTLDRFDAPVKGREERFVVLEVLLHH